MLAQEPELGSGSLDIVVDACDLMIAEPELSDLGLGLSQFDCAVTELNSGGEVEASNLLPDACVVVATSEPFASVDEDIEDEEFQRFGGLSCPCEEPYYFAPAPSKSVSKRLGIREVSRHDIAFMRGKPRLMLLWEGESH